MPVISENLRQKLNDFPVGNGLLWHKGKSGLPVFVVIGCTLKQYRIHYQSPYVYDYPPDGKLLEFPLELEDQNKNKIHVSLLLNPADTMQWDVLGLLAVASVVEVWECDQQRFECHAQQLMDWPKIYRDIVRTIQTEVRPSMDWSTLLKKWQKSEKKSLVAQEVSPSIEAPLSPKPEGKANQELSLPPKQEPKSPPALPISAPPPYQSQRIPLSVWKELQKANPLSLLLWRSGQDKIAECFIRVPRNFAIKSLAVQYSTPVLQTYKLEGSIILLPFTISTTAKQKSYDKGVSIFNPSNVVDQTILSQTYLLSNRAK